MHRNVKRAVTLVVSIAGVLAVMTAGASANRLSVNRREVRMVWSGMTFTTLNGERLVCPVTLEGEFEAATFVKTLNVRIGFINAATYGCAERIRLLFPSSWELIYRGFVGALPEIRTLELHINNFAFSWRGPFLTCIYRSEVPINISRNPETRQLTRVDFGPTRIPSTGERCRPELYEASLGGSAVITKRGEGGEGIFLYLI